MSISGISLYCLTSKSIKIKTNSIKMSHLTHSTEQHETKPSVKRSTTGKNVNVFNAGLGHTM